MSTQKTRRGPRADGPRFERFPQQELMLMHAPALEQAWSYDDEEDDDECDDLPWGVSLVDVGDSRVAVVRVRGPLMQREMYWDGYDGIESRVYAALNSSAGAVLLDIDSPGGMVAGCFDAVRRMQAAVAASGKPCIAFANERALSAAYALACVAKTVCVPQSGYLGSIGVITGVCDFTKANALNGIRVEVITSGAEKPDGNPNTKLTDAAIARFQAQTNTLAEQFFAIVSQSRGLSTEAVRALEGGVRLGRECVAAGLADQVTDLPGAIALAASLAASTTTTGQQQMKTLFAAMGLEASASEAEAVAKYNADQAQASAVMAALGAKSPEEAVAKAVAFKRDASEAAELKAKLAEEAKAQAARDRAAALDGAVKAGVMSPAERAEYDANPALSALGADAIKAAIAHRSPAVPQTKAVQSNDAAKASSLTEREREIARAHGFTDEQYAAERDRNNKRAEV